MRKVILVLMLMVSMLAGAQTLTKVNVLKKTDLGNQKLVQLIQKNDTVYAIVLKTGNRVTPEVTVALGKRDNALRLLNLLYELELGKDDALELENETENVVKKNNLGGLLVFDKLGVVAGQLRKPNIKGFINILDSDKPVREKKDIPAYARNRDED